jgi:hypothetical protein
LIVKELRYSVLPCCVCEALCSSAAEERDYAVLRLTRQPSFFYNTSGVINLPSSTT